MKTSQQTIIALLLLGCPVVAGEKRKGGMGLQHLPAIIPPAIASTASDVTLRKRQASEKFGGLSKEGGIASPYSLSSHSEYLSFEGTSVILPKGAVLHVPERLRSCMTAAPMGKIVTWPVFLASHRALVSPVDVTVEQAGGRKPLTSEITMVWSKSDMIRVATLNNCPISVPRPSNNADVPAKK